MEKVKLCIECKYYKHESVGGPCGLHVCTKHHTRSEPCLVTGYVAVSGSRPCYEERIGKGECGKEGRYWEPKG